MTQQDIEKGTADDRRKLLSMANTAADCMIYGQSHPVAARDEKLIREVFVRAYVAGFDMAKTQRMG